MDIQIDRESAIAFVDVGEISGIPEIQTMIEALLAHPDFVDGMDTIYDYRRYRNITVSRLPTNARC